MTPQETASSASSSVPTLDLNGCDKEPIHLIPAIQPHGFAIVCELPSMKILQVSNNISRYTGQEAKFWLSQMLPDFLDSATKEQAVYRIHECVARATDGPLTRDPLPLKLIFSVNSVQVSFNALVSGCANGSRMLLELEPAGADFAPISGSEFYLNMASILSKLQSAENFQSLFSVAITMVHNLTNFDRVWVHRVEPDGHLKVISEIKQDRHSPFLGMYFPASDIPNQARRLYALNRIRFIADVSAQNVLLVPEKDPLTVENVDLSNSYLRAVSPVHIEYLQNMGVTSSMSISLVVDGKLWGLISCHNDSPINLSFRQRAACDLIGQAVSTLIPLGKVSERNIAERERRVFLNGISEYFWNAGQEKVPPLDALTHCSAELLALLNADGFAVHLQNKTVWSCGVVPNPAVVDRILDRIHDMSSQSVFSSESLSSAFPDICSKDDAVGGFLCQIISVSEPLLVIWYRVEKKQVIPWGGDPQNKVQASKDGTRLAPRSSFEIWNQLVRGKCAAWDDVDKQMAFEFSAAFTAKVMTERAENLSELNKKLAASNRDLDSFAYVASHDLKEPVRGIHTYSSFILEDHGAELNNESRRYLGRVMELTAHMNGLIDALLHYSRLVQVPLDFQRVPLRQIVEDTCRRLEHLLTAENANVKIVGELPTCLVDPIQMAEVFNNLIVNSLKYNDSKTKVIEIGSTNQQSSGQRDKEIIFVRDNGIGIAPEHHSIIFDVFKRLHAKESYGGGTGAGLTIIRRILDRHHGSVWVESEAGKGATFFFDLPVSAQPKMPPKKDLLNVYTSN